VTLKNLLLICAPTIGLNTESAIFQVPVRNAKTVPSIPGGVIFANRARHGKMFIASTRHPNTTSVKIRKVISLTPTSKFHLEAKQNLRPVEKTHMIVE